MRPLLSGGSGSAVNSESHQGRGRSPYKRANFGQNETYLVDRDLISSWLTPTTKLVVDGAAIPRSLISFRLKLLVSQTNFDLHISIDTAATVYYLW